MLDKVMREADEFDVLHFHTDFLHFPLFRNSASRTVTTLHGRLDMPDFSVAFSAFPEMPVVSISDAQREPLSWANWQATVHHGLPTDMLQLGKGKGGYLAFLGRICPDKRPDRAIGIAQRAGLPLRIAAKVDPADEAYFQEVIRPMLDSPYVEFIGEIGEHEKAAFLGDAAALLFPIDWPEPFGLVMIEAMACGTPVVAYPQGSSPEIIEEGVTGFLRDDEVSAALAVEQALALDREAVRRRFEERFSVERMALDYIDVYTGLATRPPSARLRPLVRPHNGQSLMASAA